MLPTWIIAAVAAGYLGLLFVIAYLGERAADAGRSLIANPYVYTLSLGVFFTAWAFYGDVGVAANAGIGHLMLVASSRFEVPLAFAGLIVTGLMGVGMYVICVAIEQRMTGWATRGSEGVTFGN